MKNNQLRNYVIVFLAAILGGIISIGGYKMLEQEEPVEVGKDTSVQPKFTKYNVKEVEVPSFNFKEVSDMVKPSVVHIKTKVSRGGGRSQRFDFFEELYPPKIGSGSGVIVSSKGHILTNNHVIADASEIKVILNDKRQFEAEVVGRDPSTDLAVIQVDANDLQPVGFGDSDDLQVGEWVLAVGNPFNLTSTVTAGIVSAKARNLNILGGGSHIESFIQTDAAVNPGNSGGALVGIDGKLVGINTAIASKTGQYAGYSFAVPASIANKVFKDIKEFGEVKRGFIGVRIRNVTEEVAQDNNLANITGAYVAQTTANSAAEEAGIQSGDIIVSVDGRQVSSVPELQEIVGLKRPGDEVKVTIVRDGEKLTKELTLRGKEGDMKVASNEEPSKLKKELGAEFEALDEQKAQELGIDEGVQVKAVNQGKFQEIGIPEGFIITKINNKQVNSKDEIYRIISSNQSEGVLIEGLNPDGSKGYYGFGLN